MQSISNSDPQQTLGQLQLHRGLRSQIPSDCHVVDENRVAWERSGVQSKPGQACKGAAQDEGLGDCGKQSGIGVGSAAHIAPQESASVFERKSIELLLLKRIVVCRAPYGLFATEEHLQLVMWSTKKAAAAETDLNGPGLRIFQTFCIANTAWTVLLGFASQFLSHTRAAHVSHDS